ncbi:hypothetical protein Cgig2_006532 [Carnegiea gigantea]|uniref:Uncharacterized protein n=1 Tax=Carnegiea gigantea TaxID=171969 RepID=A0A9Q1JIK7_9CARY|nr:hypothetical protein Cgig2_006532 [Carnegiea gigantea]
MRGSGSWMVCPSAIGRSVNWGSHPWIPGTNRPSKTVSAASQATGGSPLSTQRPSTNFIKAESQAKFLLVQDLVKSWNLVTPDSSDPPKVTEEKCQLEKALAKAEADVTTGVKRVAQAKEQGYQQGHTETLGYLRKAKDEGRDPEEVEFIPPSGEGEGARDEATNPLDAEAEASEEEGHEDSGEPDVCTCRLEIKKKREPKYSTVSDCYYIRSVDGVHQGDEITSGVRKFLQTVLGYDVNRATRVDQNSPHNRACYLHLNDQGVVMGRGESWNFLSAKHHCGYRYAGSLLYGQHLLCTSELSFPGWPSYPFRIAPTIVATTSVEHSSSRG